MTISVATAPGGEIISEAKMPNEEQKPVNTPVSESQAPASAPANTTPDATTGTSAPSAKVEPVKSANPKGVLGDLFKARSDKREAKAQAQALESQLAALRQQNEELARRMEEISRRNEEVDDSPSMESPSRPGKGWREEAARIAQETLSQREREQQFAATLARADEWLRTRSEIKEDPMAEQAVIDRVRQMVENNRSQGFASDPLTLVKVAYADWREEMGMPDTKKTGSAAAAQGLKPSAPTAGGKRTYSREEMAAKLASLTPGSKEFSEYSSEITAAWQEGRIR